MSDFTRLAFYDRREVVGARWWQEHLAAAIGRRDSLKSLGYLAVALLGVGAAAKILSTFGRPSGANSGSSSSSSLGDDDLHVTKDAIDLQRAEGWDVGRSGEALTFSSPSVTDIDGGTSFASALKTLADDLTPAQARLQPYYVPTLFQWAATLGEAERAAVTPMHSGDMDRAFAQGHALASLFKGLPHESAVIVDMPGPQAVAFAAGMAESFEPIFTFDNWPHPAGVVASHETLAAALFYAPLLRRLASSRAAGAPPVFVLDAHRLATYTDEKSQFDNRYLAKLPTKDNLASLGVKHLLYVADGVYRESDDLNDDFVAFKAAGLDPKMVDRGDFSLASDADAGPSALVAIGASDAGAAPPNAGYTYAPRPVYYTTPYYYGGYPYTHYYFWHSYGWYTPSYAYSARPPAYVSSGHSYQPTPRPTIFTGTGAGSGRTRPGGFGRVSVTTSRQTGHVTSTTYGGGSGRTGSFGRTGSGGGGGYGGGYSG